MAPQWELECHRFLLIVEAAWLEVSLVAFFWNQVMLICQGPYRYGVIASFCSLLPWGATQTVSERGYSIFQSHPNGNQSIMYTAWWMSMYLCTPWPWTCSRCYHSSFNLRGIYIVLWLLCPFISLYSNLGWLLALSLSIHNPYGSSLGNLISCKCIIHTQDNATGRDLGEKPVRYHKMPTVHTSLETFRS